MGFHVNLHGVHFVVTRGLVKSLEFKGVEVNWVNWVRRFSVTPCAVAMRICQSVHSTAMNAKGM